MKFLSKIFLIIVFCLLCFAGYSASFRGTEVTTDTDQTEADSKNDTRRSSDMCCDRQNTKGWAQGLSEQESRAIVNHTLASRRDSTEEADPSSSSGSSGQR